MYEPEDKGAWGDQVPEDSDDHRIGHRSSHDERIESFTVITTMIYDDNDDNLVMCS